MTDRGAAIAGMLEEVAGRLDKIIERSNVTVKEMAARVAAKEKALEIEMEKAKTLDKEVKKERAESLSVDFE